MYSILKFCSIISIVIFSLRLAIIGNLSQTTVIIIMVCGILILIGNRAIYIISAAIASLVLFTKHYEGSPDGESALLQSLLALVIVLFGIYIMIRGVFTSNKNVNNRTRY